MDCTNFENSVEYSVSISQHSTSRPLTAELTRTKVLRKKIHLFMDERKPLVSLPDQNIEHHTSFIPLLNEPTNSTNIQTVVGSIVRHCPNEATIISRPSKSTTNYYSLDYTRISDIMSSFGVTKYGCSTILRDIDKAVKSSPSRGRGMVEIKIWRIRTEVYKFNRAAERLLLESYNPPGYRSDVPIVLDLMREEKQECVICMESHYSSYGSVVTKLPCNHDFHGVCIYEWLQLNRLCPLCRSPISKGVQSGFQFCFGSVVQFVKL
ncbi:PREDICTED: protein SAN1 [Camelina sativa]|uniref:Protein SAN1 n=1 Tax=Camelina sativa TaxID=90675 RepID=A0ABM0TU80_CAMSA|nr:PREDICTED: protein SAN1 [Camelina sativa]